MDSKIECKVIGEHWWLTKEGQPIRRLSDDEAAWAIWGTGTKPTEIVEDESLIEALADYAHDAWSKYMCHMFGKCKIQDDDSIVIPTEYACHLQRLIDLPYGELSEAEKNSDREEAEMILSVVFPKGPAPWCCHLGCQEKATWVIEYQKEGSPLDNYSHACSRHVGDLLEDCQHIVYPMAFDGEDGDG